MEAAPGFEPGIKALQASALPLGHAADLERENGKTIGTVKPQDFKIQEP